MTNSDPDRRIEEAYERLAAEAAYVQTPDAPGLRTRPVWVVPALAAGILIVAGVIGVVALSDDGDRPTNVIAEPGESTTTPSPGTETPATPTVADDLYYPWLYPPPYLAYYEEGCAAPESVVRDFAANTIGDLDPVVTLLTDDGDRVEVLIHAKGEGGSVLDTGSIATVARVDPGSIVDCDAWGVLSVTAPDDVTIDSPAMNSTVGTNIEVSGSGRGFESQIELRILDDSYEAVAEGFTHGGLEIEPFTGSVLLDRQPLDRNLIVIAQSGGAAEGAIEPFAAVKVRYDSTEIERLPESTEPGTPIAVTGVEPDDTLNVRSAPGISNDIVGVVSPFDSELLRHGVVERVGDDEWIRVTHLRHRNISGWVNSRFTTEIEAASDADPLLYRALTDVREAFSLNESSERLADVVAAQGSPSVTISDDETFDGSDTVLMLEELWEGDTVIDEIGSSPAIDDPGSILIETGDTPSENATDLFPGSTSISLFHGPEAPDLDISTVRLVFVPWEGGWVLTAIALG